MNAFAEALDSAHILLADGRMQDALDALDAIEGLGGGDRSDGRYEEFLKAQLLARLGRVDEAKNAVAGIWYMEWLAGFAGETPAAYPDTDADLRYNLDRALELAPLLPDDFMPTFLAARFAMELGEADRASQLLDKSGELLEDQRRREPASVKDNFLTGYWRARTDCATRLRDWQEVVDTAGRWLDLENDNTTALAKRAMGLMLLDDYPGAREAWTKLLAVKPDDVLALEYLHSIETEMDGVLSAGALATLAAAYRAIAGGAEIDQRQRVTWANEMYEASLALTEAGRIAEATSWLECAIWLGGDDADVLGNRAACLMSLNDYPKALEAATKLLSLRPDDMGVLAIRLAAETAIDGALGVSALATLSTAYRLISDGLQVDRVGWANDMYNTSLELGRAGRYAEAASWLECAIWVFPDDPDFHQQLTRMRLLAD